MAYDIPDTGPGRLMRYPYGKLAKLYFFPWGHYWKYGRGFRYIFVGIGLSVPILYQISKAVNSPGNVEMWKEIRAKRRHDPFAPPTEKGGHH